MIKKWQKENWFKLVVVLALSIIFYYILYSSLTYGLDVPSIEIKNECKKNENSKGGSCERKFDVPTYFEEIKTKLGEVPRNQTFLEKLAGITPDVFEYSIGFDDASSYKIRKGQHSELWKNPPRGDCLFPKGFEEKEKGGYYKEKFGLLEIPMRLEELATSLNDCKQYEFLFSENVDKFEREEKYNIFIKMGFWSYIFLAILSFSLTAIILNVIKFLWKFIVKDFLE